jgi:peroxiredoxin
LITTGRTVLFLSPAAMAPACSRQHGAQKPDAVPAAA